MTTPRRRPDLIDVIHELTEQHQHRELYMRKKKPRYHNTDNPPLLTQLNETVEPSYTKLDGAGRVATSRPAANVDAIDTATRIHTDAAHWLRTLGHDDTGDTVTVVRRLGSLHPNQDRCGRKQPRWDQHHRNVTCCTAHRIEADIRHWWTWARLTTGWDLPAWQPDNTCPLCGERGTIRVRVTDRIASCANDNCRATWYEATFGLLVEHIRGENGELAS